jgi:hypothetical protein
MPAACVMALPLLMDKNKSLACADMETANTVAAIKTDFFIQNSKIS